MCQRVEFGSGLDDLAPSDTLTCEEAQELISEPDKLTIVNRDRLGKHFQNCLICLEVWEQAA